MDDAPSAEVGSGSNGGVGGQDDGPAKFPPVAQHVSFGHESARVESASDDAHGFLGVVASMAQAVCGGGEQLQFTEPAVHRLWRFILQNPVGGDQKNKT